MAAVKVLERPLDAIYRDAGLYPVHLLRYRETGLCLFAAAFLGANDAVHMARLGMRVTCVDVDADRLNEMRNLYPPDWEFYCSDAFRWAYWEGYARAKRWDVVSVDTFTGDATDMSLRRLEHWCALSNRVVTATVAKGQAWEAPEGWRGELYARGPIADWLVLQRA